MKWHRTLVVMEELLLRRVVMRRRSWVQDNARHQHGRLARLSAAVIAALFMLAPNSALAAAEDPGDTTSRTEVLLGPIDGETAEALLGSERAVTGLESEVSVASEGLQFYAAATPAPRGPGPIISWWYDKQGWRVNLREVPFSKIRGHGLTSSTVRRVTERARKEHESGTSYRYHARAQLVECGIWNCTVKGSQRIRVVVNFKEGYDRKKYGVVTAYCVRSDRGPCPSWVNRVPLNS